MHAHVVRRHAVCLLEERTACGVIVGGVWYSEMRIIGHMVTHS